MQHATVLSNHVVILCIFQACNCQVVAQGSHIGQAAAAKNGIAQNLSDLNKCCRQEADSVKGVAVQADVRYTSI